MLSLCPKMLFITFVGAYNSPLTVSKHVAVGDGASFERNYCSIKVTLKLWSNCKYEFNVIFWLVVKKWFVLNNILKMKLFKKIEKLFVHIFLI